MPRKAIFRDKPELTKETMSKKDLEYYFTTIHKRFDEVDKRFGEQDKKMETILDVVKFYEVERKDLKSIILEHDIRLRKLEKHSV